MERVLTPGSRQSSTSYAKRPPVSVALLAGLSGSMRVDVKGTPAGVIDVQNGTVSVNDPAGEATAVASVEDGADFLRILRGELNPVVAAIQGRLALEGDYEFAVQVILALHAAKPFPPLSGEG